jgi:hypothetical protein
MSALSEINPRDRQLIIDLVREAGVNVNDWKNFKGGPSKAASNPKYCYEWSFVEPKKLVVLNLWYASMQERDGFITQEMNWRELARRFEERPHNGVWKRRSLNVDRSIQLAFRERLPIRVVVCEGEMRNIEEPEAKASRVHKRLLDLIPWAVTAYDWRSGQCTVTRGASPDRNLLTPTPRFFTHYWLNETWERNREYAAEGELLNHTGGNLFLKRGIGRGDIVYVVSVIKGALYLCGKLMVEKICDFDEAAAILGHDPWDAKEHIMAGAATPMNFHRRLPLKLTRQLKLISGRASKSLNFKAPGYLDEQTLRGVRELDPESAADLDGLLPPFEEVSFEDKFSYDELFPGEVIDAQTYHEGATKRISVNVYERNAKARRVCIAHYGWDCFVCGFNFKSVYGNDGDRFIHVHHLRPLSEVGEDYELDPIEDLRPICPNCHVMIHKRKRTYTIEELRELLSKARES